MRISDWSSDVCSSDLQAPAPPPSTDDTAASRQLQARLATDEDLDEVTASVDNGVAELDGTVLQPAHRQEAGKIATGPPGVETVVNKIGRASCRERVCPYG